VVLSQVLAHCENLGYGQYGALHLAEVDGLAVRNLRQLKGMVEGGEFVRFRFEPHRTVVVVVVVVVVMMVVMVVLERGSVGRITHEVCREQSITERFFSGEGVRMIFTDL